MECAMPSSPEERRPRELSSAPSRESTEETLRRLEQRLDRASQAAERLIAEAAVDAARAGAGRRDNDPGGAGGGTQDSAEPPPSGWQIPDDAGTSPSPDLDPFVGLVQALVDLIPPELQQRLAAALRELLLALRALIDWYLERLERGRQPSVEPEDIPIL